ncbi:hypothetical protein LDENG_00055430 [Lucifuga dentata]|nr:hypothetical protein LDENG_00055430 [Lucifuga dentata]
MSLFPVHWITAIVCLQDCQNKVFGISNLFRTLLPESWRKTMGLNTSLICLYHMNFLGPLGHLGLAYWLSQELEQNTVKQHFVIMQHRPGITSQMILDKPQL